MLVYLYEEKIVYILSFTHAPHIKPDFVILPLKTEEKMPLESNFVLSIHVFRLRKQNSYTKMTNFLHPECLQIFTGHRAQK